jgi:Fe-S cluster assembly iron-binding protein IscA
LALDEPKETDKTFEASSIKYIIDSDLMARTGEVTIDFVDSGYQSGFSISSAKPVAGGGGCSAGGSCSC